MAACAFRLLSDAQCHDVRPGQLDPYPGLEFGVDEQLSGVAGPEKRVAGPEFWPMGAFAGGRHGRYAAAMHHRKTGRCSLIGMLCLCALLGCGGGAPLTTLSLSSYNTSCGTAADCIAATVGD